MVQNQAQVTQLAPATSDKSSSLPKLPGRDTAPPAWGKMGSKQGGQELCLSQNTNSRIYRACHTSKGTGLFFAFLFLVPLMGWGSSGSGAAPGSSTTVWQQQRLMLWAHTGIYFHAFSDSFCLTWAISFQMSLNKNALGSTLLFHLKD